MRTATMRGRKHGSDIFEPIALDHVPIVEQIKMKQAALMKKENAFAEIIYQPSDSAAQKFHFAKPAEVPAQQKSRK